MTVSSIRVTNASLPSEHRSAAPSPRVIFVGNYLSSPGRRSVGEDLAERLVQDGWSVRMTSRRQSRYLRVLDRLATVWRERHHYDIALVDVYSGAAFRWAEVTCGLLHSIGTPYVLTLHGGNLPALVRRIPDRARRLLAGAAAVTAPSAYVLDACHDIRPDGQLIHNPIDPNTYPHRVREQPRPRLIWLRAFHEIYNPTLAPNVVARLVRDFPSITLQMVGPDKDGTLERTRTQAATDDVADRLTIVPGIPKSDVPHYLDGADIFLNTTNIDNSPVSVLEAMAAGLCIVSTNVGGMPYLVEHEREALLVPPRDGPAMANAVRRILTEPGLAARLSRNARAKAERFAWDVILPQWTTLLRDVARRHSSHAHE